MPNNAIPQFLFNISDPGPMPQREAEDALTPLLPGIAAGVTAAFAASVDDISPETRERLDGGVRGQLVTKLIWEFVADHLTGEPGVKFCNKLKFFKVIVDDAIVIRFKRLNSELLAASQASRQAQDWFGNRPIKEVDSSLLRLTFGYRPNPTWTSCEDFFLTHQSSFSTLDWVSELLVIAGEPDGLAKDETSSLELPEIKLKQIQTRVSEGREQA